MLFVRRFVAVCTRVTVLSMLSRTQYGPSTLAHLREKSCSVDPLPPSYMSSSYERWVFFQVPNHDERIGLLAPNIANPDSFNLLSDGIGKIPSILSRRCRRWSDTPYLGASSTSYKRGVLISQPLMYFLCTLRLGEPFHDGALPLSNLATWQVAGNIF